jgi:D-galactarolactone cycloisomerase
VGQSGLAINAMSGIDIAIWDIIGKALNRPVYQLLGGAYRTKLTPYATGFYKTKGYTSDDAIAEANRYIEQGFKAIKLAIGFGVEEDIDYIHKVREGLGYGIKIMADANCAYNLSTSKRILHECEDTRLEFFEELLPPDDYEGFKELKLHTATSLATGENLFTKRNYRRWIAERAADVFQPEIASCGGITELKRIGAMAHAYDTRIIPHNWGSGIAQAATMQYIANLPPVPMSLVPTCEPMMEYDLSEHPFSQDLIYGAIRIEDGLVPVPDKPGIGVEVDESVIKCFCKQ